MDIYLTPLKLEGALHTLLIVGSSDQVVGLNSAIVRGRMHVIALSTLEEALTHEIDSYNAVLVGVNHTSAHQGCKTAFDIVRSLRSRGFSGPIIANTVSAEYNAQLIEAGATRDSIRNTGAAARDILDMIDTNCKEFFDPAARKLLDAAANEWDNTSSVKDSFASIPGGPSDKQFDLVSDQITRAEVHCRTLLRTVPEQRALVELAVMFERAYHGAHYAKEGRKV